jgi:hypothetical protein
MRAASRAPQQAVGLSTTCAGDAVSAIEEAMGGPGPGVGTTGVPRAVLFQPEEVSRSTVVDPPQARTHRPLSCFDNAVLLTRALAMQVVRDAVKMSATQSGGCRHVLLMSSDPAILDSARQQRSISCGAPAAVCDFLEEWLAQVRGAHRALEASQRRDNGHGDGAAALEGVASAEGGAAGAEDATPQRRKHKSVRFGPVLDDGGRRRGYRGYSPPPCTEEEAAAAAAGAQEEPPPRTSPQVLSRKREREGAALSARPDSEPEDGADAPAAAAASGGLLRGPPPGFPNKRQHTEPAPLPPDCL